jgi:hypothetical protein
MGQLIYQCECGWTDSGNRYLDLCPVCSSLEVKNAVNVDTVALNDSRAKHPLMFQTTACNTVYQDCSHR